jgi:iron complex outermembrane receptor protein
MKIVLSAAASALLAQISMAADSPPERLSEVVVTARRVPEVAAQLPLAIDVVQVGRIAPGGVQNLDTLASQFPGLSFESLWGGSLAAPVLRGQSQPSTAGDNVGVFVDDIYQAGRSAIDVPLLDLERIEVVRGPQNTQFGRSTFAGAIRYVPAQPTAELTRLLRAEIGSDSLAGLQVVGSRRIFDSAWLGRVALGYRGADGTRRSTADESLGDFQQQSAALTLVRESAVAGYHPVALSVRFQQSRYGLPASSTLNARDFNCGSRDAASGLWSYYCGAVPVAARFSLTPNLPDSRARSGQIALRFEIPLGALTLRSLSGFYGSSSTTFRDFDGSALGLLSGVCTTGVNCLTNTPLASVTRFVSPNVVSRPQQSTTDWTQEFRLGRENSAGMRWLLGIAASRTRIGDNGAFGVDRGDLLAAERLTSIVASNPNRVGSLSLLNSALVEDSRLQQISQSESRNRSDVLAAFGALDLPLTARSRVRLELRAEREELRIRSLRANFQPDSTPAPAPLQFTELLPRISIDLRPGEPWYVYASVARGARSGGINVLPGLNEDERGFEPEYNWTSELGLRFRGSGWIQDFRSTLYRIDWKNTQILGVSATPGVNNLITGNTAGLTTHGVETELLLRMGSLWTGRFAFSWTDPRFDTGSDDAGSRVFCGLTVQPPGSSFCPFGPPRSDSNGSVRLVPYLDDNLAARTPRRSLNIGLQFRPRLAVLGWQASVEGDFAWQDDVFERPIDGAYYGSRGLLSARGILEKGDWRVEIWGTNLLNDSFVRAAASRGGAFYPSLPRPLDLLLGEGRRIGLSLGLDLTPR